MVGAPTRFKLDKDHTSDMHTTFVSRSACFVRRARFSSQAETTLCVIGAGKMSEAMLGGIQTSRELKISALRVYDPNAKRGELFASKFGATVAGSLEEALAGSSTIVLSCKPQNLAGVFRAACGHIGDESLVVSIIAGCTIDTLQAGLGARGTIVRSMPNTPAMVREGITAWTATDDITDEQRSRTRALLGSFGEEIFVGDESYLDMATALSGSGPAYVLMLTEAWIETGVQMGFPRDIATRLVQQTLRGTAEYMRQSGDHPAMLRNDITSPGGTTAAAIYALEKGGFRTVLADGVWAAYRRSLELGELDSNVGPGRARRPGEP